MEVASMMPGRLHEAYNPSLQYAQYHDLRTPLTAGPMPMSGTRQMDYSHFQQAHHNLPSESPTAAPTPPEDLNKPSLPSISNLLGIADGDRTSRPQSESRSPTQQKSQTAAQQPTPTDPSTAVSYQMAADGTVAYAQVHKPSLPPTPPMRSDSMPEAGHSPSTLSSQSTFSAQHYALGSAMNNVDAAQQRSGMSMAPHMGKPTHMSQQMYNTSPYGMVGPYAASPVSASPASYYSPEAMYPSGMYQQRPLPSTFPPTIIAAPMLPPGVIPTANGWEHQHYIMAANQAAYPTIQERYVCPTCKKAFSRPSSLKIHSHSHTGEKPFKCPHAGCGKAFSVRSNMKRHERGCHTPEMDNASTTS